MTLERRPLEAGMKFTYHGARPGDEYRKVEVPPSESEPGRVVDREGYRAGAPYSEDHFYRISVPDDASVVVYEHGWSRRAES